MNTLILYAMGIASLVVIIAGAFTVVVMIVYYIQVMWSKISACAKNTMEYLQNKQDFEVYKADVFSFMDLLKGLLMYLEICTTAPIVVAL